MRIQEEKTLYEKLKILTDAAKYDVACTSSGVDRSGEKGKLGSAVACGICHSFAADGRCISLLKVLMIGIVPLAYLGVGIAVVVKRRRMQNEAV